MVIFVSVVCTLGQKHPEDINFATKITTLSSGTGIKQHRFVKLI